MTQKLITTIVLTPDSLADFYVNASNNSVHATSHLKTFVEVDK